MFYPRIWRWLVALDFPGGSDDKASVYNVGDPGSIPGLGRSTGEGNDNPLQYYCLENPMDRGAWWARVHGVAKSWTRLSDFTYFTQFVVVNWIKNCQSNFLFPPSLSHFLLPNLTQSRLGCIVPLFIHSFMFSFICNKHLTYKPIL